MARYTGFDTNHQVIFTATGINECHEAAMQYIESAKWPQLGYVKDHAPWSVWPYLTYRRELLCYVGTPWRTLQEVTEYLNPPIPTAAIDPWGHD